MAYTAEEYRRQGERRVVERMLFRMERKAYEDGRAELTVKLEPELRMALSGGKSVEGTVDVWVGDFLDVNIR